MARTLKATINKGNLKEKLKASMNLLSQLRHVQEEPQPALPNIYVWMLSNNKRVAYYCLNAKDIVFSAVDEERGKDCGKVLTLFLKVGARVSGYGMFSGSISIAFTSVKC